jgi:hypothetical protein
VAAGFSLSPPRVQFFSVVAGLLQAAATCPGGAPHAGFTEVFY